LICVCEDHRQPGEAQNYLVSVPLTGGTNTVLVSGNDFYSSPRVSPDGSQLAWLTWHHPNMPWDGCELWMGDIGDDGSITNQTQVAGGQRDSIFQPEWSPDGVLYFVAETSGGEHLSPLLTVINRMRGRERGEFGVLSGFWPVNLRV
jgi:Tol biopolymer transport system component